MNASRRLLSLVWVLGFCTPGALSAQTTVQGAVRDETGTPVNQVTVTFRNSAAKQSFASTGFAGTYQSAPLPNGTYSVHVEGPGIAERTLDDITLSGGRVRLDLLVYRRYSPPGSTVMLWALGLVTGLYLLSIVVFRWHNIRQPTRCLLHAQVSALDIRLQTEVSPSAPAAAIERLRQHIDEIRATLTQSWFASELMFWSRGFEISAWTRVHEIERQLVSFLSPPDRVTARLLTARAELAKSTDAEALSLLARIDKSVAAEPAEDREDRKELLAEALAFLYASRDSKFATWMEWHNKANWLLVATLIFIVALAVAVDRSILFLAGAAGGFMSRLARTLDRQDVPTDYGASWTTLYLSPVFGAISAWFGIAIVALLRALAVLGDAFNLVSWDNPEHPHALAFAFVLGFSERLFNSLVAAVERRAGAAEDMRSGGTSGPGQPATVVPQPPPAPGGRSATWHTQLLQAGQSVLVIGNASTELAAIARAVAGGKITYAGTADEVRPVSELKLPNVTTVELQAGRSPVESPVDVVVCSLGGGTPESIAALASSIKPGGRLIIVDNIAGVSDDDLTTRHMTNLTAIGAANLTFVSQQKHGDVSITVARK